MKKAISILLILCLMITMAGAALAEDTLVYESSFAAGNDDWFARGAQNVKNTPEATLRTEGRTADWNSPGSCANAGSCLPAGTPRPITNVSRPHGRRA